MRGSDLFKTGLFKKLGIILAVFLLVTGIVSALTLTNVVPTWSAITGTSGDPTCLVTQTVGNEVQVRYGDDDFTAGCPADTNLYS